MGALGAAPLGDFSDRAAAAAPGDVRAADKIRTGLPVWRSQARLPLRRYRVAVPLPEGLRNVLRANASSPLPGHRRWSRPLLITQASPDSAEFVTDRGRREFPAWRLGGPEVDGAFWALDPAIAATLWRPPEPAPPKPFDGEPHRGGSAVIEGNDRTLHFSFVGGAPALFQYPSAEVIETDQAVVVLPVERYVGPPATAVTLVGFGRTVTVSLARALRQRVIVDLDASPIPVGDRCAG
jgi:hypothetical protein